MVLQLLRINTDIMSPSLDSPTEKFPVFDDHFPIPQVEAVELDSEEDQYTPSMSSIGSTPPVNRTMDKLRTPERKQPTPQPTHFSVPAPGRNGNGTGRVIRSQTIGYIAPEFKGKKDQMKQGNDIPPYWNGYMPWHLLINYSQGEDQ